MYILDIIFVVLFAIVYLRYYGLNAVRDLGISSVYGQETTFDVPVGADDSIMKEESH